MSTTSGFSIGDRVMRTADGSIGVVETMGPGTSIGVRWGSGILQMVVPALLKRV